MTSSNQPLSNSPKCECGWLVTDSSPIERHDAFNDHTFKTAPLSNNPFQPSDANAPKEDEMDGFVDARCTDRGCESKGVYRMVGTCSNCHVKALLGMFTEGHEKSTFGPCPMCGVSSHLMWLRLATADEIPAAVQQEDSDG